MHPTTRDPPFRRHGAPVVACSALIVAAFFLSTHHVGWLFNAMNDSSVVPLLLGSVVVPVIMLLVANINEIFRRWMFVLSFIIYEVSCYVVIFALPNPVIPQHMMLDPLMAFFTFLNVGASTVLLMLSFAWLAALSRAKMTRTLMPGLSIAAGGLLASLLVPTGVNGWLVPLIIAGFLIAVAVTVRFGFLHPDAERELATLSRPASLAGTVIVDTTKPLKLVLFTMACVLFMAVAMGLAAIGGTIWFHVGENALFYTGFLIGAPAASVILYIPSRSLFSMEKGPARDARSQQVMLLAITLVLATNLPAFLLDVFIPGFHGTTGAQVLLGTLFAMDLTCFLRVVVIFHPPRSFNAHVMLFSQFIIVAVILGGLLKSIYIVGDPVAEIAAYFDIVAGILLVLVIPCILACIVTWCKKTVRGERKRA